MLAADFGTGQVFWSLLWFTGLVIYVILFITVVVDLFRSHDLSGWTKFFWLLLLLLFNLVGVFAYLIIRGHKMHQHHVADAQTADAAAQAYIRQAASGAGTGVAGELERLVDLRDNGTITEAEFQKRKAQVLQN